MFLSERSRSIVPSPAGEEQVGFSSAGARQGGDRTGSFPLESEAVRSRFRNHHGPPRHVLVERSDDRLGCDNCASCSAPGHAWKGSRFAVQTLERRLATAGSWSLAGSAGSHRPGDHRPGCRRRRAGAGQPGDATGPETMGTRQSSRWATKDAWSTCSARRAFPASAWVAAVAGRSRWLQGSRGRCEDTGRNWFRASCFMRTWRRGLPRRGPGAPGWSAAFVWPSIKNDGTSFSTA